MKSFFTPSVKRFAFDSSLWDGADFSGNCIKNNGRSKPLPYAMPDSREGCPYVICKLKITHKYRLPLTRELSFFFRKMTEGEITKIRYNLPLSFRHACGAPPSSSEEGLVLRANSFDEIRKFQSVRSITHQIM